MAGGSRIADNHDLLIVVTPACRGTAVLIAPDLVVTAAHVVQPYLRALTPAPQIRLVATDGASWSPAAVVPHHRWATGFARAADMALLWLARPLADERVTPITEDAPADDLAVAIDGFGADGSEVTNTGTVSRLAGGDGLDVLVSSDLTFPDGVSGSPILDADQRAIGIATWCPRLPTANSFIGIPFLTATLGWLRENL